MTSGVRSLWGRSDGELYFEAVVIASHGARDCVGVMLDNVPYDGLVIGGTSGAACFADGSIFANGVPGSGNLGIWGAGDCLAVAVSFTSAGIWFRRRPAGGNWLDWNAVPGADPASGVGALSIAAYAGQELAPVVAFGGAGATIGDQVAVNFGLDSFRGTVPYGWFPGWSKGLLEISSRRADVGLPDVANDYAYDDHLLGHGTYWDDGTTWEDAAGSSLAARELLYADDYRKGKREQIGDRGGMELVFHERSG